MRATSLLRLLLLISTPRTLALVCYTCNSTVPMYDCAERVSARTPSKTCRPPLDGFCVSRSPRANAGLFIRGCESENECHTGVFNLTTQIVNCCTTNKCNGDFRYKPKEKLKCYVCTSANRSSAAPKCDAIVDGNTTIASCDDDDAICAVRKRGRREYERTCVPSTFESCATSSNESRTLDDDDVWECCATDLCNGNFNSTGFGNRSRLGLILFPVAISLYVHF